MGLKETSEKRGAVAVMTGGVERQEIKRTKEGMKPLPLESGRESETLSTTNKIKPASREQGFAFLKTFQVTARVLAA